MIWPLLLVLSQAGVSLPADQQRHVAAAPLWTSVFTGSREQVEAFLAAYSAPDVRRSDQIEFLGRDRLPDGRERLRYLIPQDLPYRDVGGMIYLAQRHRLEIHFESPEASHGR